MDTIKTRILLLLDNIRIQWQKFSNRDKILLCILLFFVPLFVYFKLFLSPELEKLDKINKKKQNLEKKLNDIQTKKIFIAKVRKELDRKTKILLKAQSILPTTNEIPELLTAISTEATKAGLKILLFKPGDEIKKDYYSIIPIEINVEGPFQQIVIFLDNIRRLERIVNAKDVNFVRAKREDNNWTVVANCKLETYRFLTEKEQQEQAQKKNGKKKKKK